MSCVTTKVLSSHESSSTFEMQVIEWDVKKDTFLYFFRSGVAMLECIKELHVHHTLSLSSSWRWQRKKWKQEEGGKDKRRDSWQARAMKERCVSKRRKLSGGSSFTRRDNAVKQLSSQQHQVHLETKLRQVFMPPAWVSSNRNINQRHCEAANIWLQRLEQLHYSVICREVFGCLFGCLLPTIFC